MMPQTPKKTHYTGSIQPAQMTFFAVFESVPMGDGSFRIVPKAGQKPVSELSPKEFAQAVGGIGRPVSLSTVYRWIDEGVIGAHEWRRVGKLKILIQGSAVDRIRHTGEFKKWPKLENQPQA